MNLFNFKSCQGFCLFKKAVALVLSAALLLGPETAYAVSSAIPHAKEPIHPENEISIPEKWGSVDEIFEGKSGKRVIYIQDAHDSLEAQVNISEMIHSLVKRYGVKTVFEEGYQGPVPTEKYFTKIKDPKIRERVAYYLMDQLRLGAAEYAHIIRCGQGAGNSCPGDFELIGADNLDLHQENIDRYKDSKTYLEETQNDLRMMESEISQLVQKRFAAELKLGLEIKQKFERQEIDMLDYLKRTQALFLKGIGFEEFRVRYPNISLLLSAGEIKGENLVQQVKAALNYKTLFEEIARLENDYVDLHYKELSDREIFRYYRQIQLLKRLSGLEVTEEEYLAARDVLKTVDTKNIAAFLVTQNKKSIVLSKRWENHIENAVNFYETARARDHSIQAYLEKYQKGAEQTPVILVYGGFHKGSIRELLRENGFSFTVLSPKITEMSPKHQAYYKQLMGLGYEDISLPSVLAKATTPPRLLAEGVLRPQLEPEIQNLVDLIAVEAEHASNVDEMDLALKRRSEVRRPEKAQVVQRLLEIYERKDDFEESLDITPLFTRMDLLQGTAPIDFPLPRGKIWDRSQDRDLRIGKNIEQVEFTVRHSQGKFQFVFIPLTLEEALSRLFEYVKAMRSGKGLATYAKAVRAFVKEVEPGTRLYVGERNFIKIPNTIRAAKLRFVPVWNDPVKPDLGIYLRIESLDGIPISYQEVTPNTASSFSARPEPGIKELRDYIEVFLKNGDLAESGEKVTAFTKKANARGVIALGRVQGVEARLTVEAYKNQDIHIEPIWVDEADKSKGIYLKLAASDGTEWTKDFKKDGNLFSERKAKNDNEIALLHYLNVLKEGGDLEEAGKKLNRFTKKTEGAGGLYFGSVGGRRAVIGLPDYQNQEIEVEPIWIDEEDKAKGIYLKLTAPDGKIWHRYPKKEGNYFEKKKDVVEGVAELLNYIKVFVEGGDLAQAGERLKPFSKKTDKTGNVILGQIAGRLALAHLTEYRNQIASVEPLWIDETDKTKGVYVKFSAEDGRVWYKAIKNEGHYFEGRSAAGLHELLRYIEMLSAGGDIAAAGVEVREFTKRTDRGGGLTFGTISGQQVIVTLTGYENNDIKVEPYWLDPKDKSKGIYLKLSAADGMVWNKKFREDGIRLDPLEGKSQGHEDLLKYMEVFLRGGDLAEAGKNLTPFVKRSSRDGILFIGVVLGKKLATNLASHGDEEIRVEMLWEDILDKAKGIYLKLTASDNTVWYRNFKKDGFLMEKRVPSGLRELLEYLDALAAGGDLASAGGKIQPFKVKIDKGGLTLRAVGGKVPKLSSYGNGDQEMHFEPMWIDRDNKSKGVRLMLTREDGKIQIYDISNEFPNYFRQNKELTRRISLQRNLNLIYKLQSDFKESIDITALFSAEDLARGLLPADFPAPDGRPWPADKRDMGAGTNLEKVEMIITRKDGKLSVIFSGTQAARSEVRGSDKVMKSFWIWNRQEGFVFQSNQDPGASDSKKKEEKAADQGISRRSFLEWTSALLGTSALPSMGTAGKSLAMMQAARNEVLEMLETDMADFIFSSSFESSIFFSDELSLTDDELLSRYLSQVEENLKSSTVPLSAKQLHSLNAPRKLLETLFHDNRTMMQDYFSDAEGRMGWVLEEPEFAENFSQLTKAQQEQLLSDLIAQQKDLWGVWVREVRERLLNLSKRMDESLDEFQKEKTDNKSKDSKLSRKEYLIKELLRFYSSQKDSELRLDITGLLREEELRDGIVPSNFPLPEGKTWGAEKSRDLKIGTDLEKVEMVLTRKDGKLSVIFSGTQAARSEVRSGEGAEESADKKAKKKRGVKKTAVTVQSLWSFDEQNGLNFENAEIIKGEKIETLVRREFENLKQKLNKDMLNFLASRYGVDLKQILWRMIGSSLSGKFDQKAVESAIDAEFVGLINEMSKSEETVERVAQTPEDKDVTVRPFEMNLSQEDIKKIAGSMETRFKELDGQSTIDRGLYEMAYLQATIFITKLEENFFFKNYYRANPDAFIGTQAQKHIREILDSETQPMIHQALEKVLEKIQASVQLQEKLYEAGLKAPLNLYQLAAVEQMLETQRVVLGDEMGLGKTLEVLAVFLLSGADELTVFAPNLAIKRWLEDIGAHINKGIDLAVLVDEFSVPKALEENQNMRITKFKKSKDRYNYLLSDRAPPEPGRKRVILMNYEAVPFLEKHRRSESKPKPSFEFLAFDEAHLLKNAGSATSRALWGSGKEQEAFHGLFEVIMTGTPLENGPQDLLRPLKYLAHNDPSEGAKMFSEIDSRRYAQIFKKSDIGKLSLLHAYMASRMIRRLKADVMTGLPEKKWKIAKLDPLTGTMTIDGKVQELPGDYKRQLDMYEFALTDPEAFERLHVHKVALDEDADEEESEGAEEPASTYARTTQIIRLEQTALDAGIFGASGGSIKMDAAEALIREALAQNKSIFISSPYRTATLQLSDHLKRKGLGQYISYIDGKVKKTQRGAEIDRFQNKETRIFIGTTPTAGVSINLTQADVIIRLNRTWKPSTDNQAVDRAHRYDPVRNFPGKTLDIIDLEWDVPVSIDRLKADFLRSKEILAEIIINGNLTPEIMKAFRDSDERMVETIELVAGNVVKFDEYEQTVAQKFRLLIGKILQTKDPSELERLWAEAAEIYIAILDHKGSFYANMASLDHLASEAYPELKGGAPRQALDLASGPSTLYRAYERRRMDFAKKGFHLDITDYDASEQMLKFGVRRPGKQFLGNFAALKDMPSSAYDLVNLSYAFRYAEHPAEVIQHIHRMLKDKGIFVLILPSTNEIPPRFYEALKQAGFTLRVGENAQLASRLDDAAYKEFLREFGKEFADDMARHVKGVTTYLVASKDSVPERTDFVDADFFLERELPKVNPEKIEAFKGSEGEYKFIPASGTVVGEVKFQEDSAAAEKKQKREQAKLFQRAGRQIKRLSEAIRRYQDTRWGHDPKSEREQNKLAGDIDYYFDVLSQEISDSAKDYSADDRESLIRHIQTLKEEKYVRTYLRKFPEREQDFDDMAQSLSSARSEVRSEGVNNAKSDSVLEAEGSENILFYIRQLLRGEDLREAALKLNEFSVTVNPSASLYFGRINGHEAQIRLKGYAGKRIIISPQLLDLSDPGKGAFLVIKASDGKVWEKVFKKDGAYFEEKKTAVPTEEGIRAYIKAVIEKKGLAEASKLVTAFEKMTDKNANLLFGVINGKPSGIRLANYKSENITITPMRIDADNQERGIYLKLRASDGTEWERDFKDDGMYFEERKEFVPGLEEFVSYVKAVQKNEGVLSAAQKLETFVKATDQGGNLNFGENLKINLGAYRNRDIQITPLPTDSSGLSEKIKFMFEITDGSQVWYYDVDPESKRFFAQDTNATGRERLLRLIKKRYERKESFFARFDITKLFSLENLRKGFLPADFPGPDGKPWPAEKRYMGAGTNLEKVEMTIIRKDGKLSISFKGTQAARSEARAIKSADKLSDKEAQQRLLEYIETFVEDGDLAKAGERLQSFKGKVGQSGTFHLGTLLGKHAKFSTLKNHEITIDSFWIDENSKSKGVFLKVTDGGGNVSYKTIKKDGFYFEDRAQPGAYELLEYIKVVKENGDLEKAGEKIQPFSMNTVKQGNLRFGVVDKAPVQTSFAGYENQEMKVEPQWLDPNNKANGIYLKFTAKDETVWYKSVQVETFGYLKRREEPGKQELLDYIETFVNEGDLAEAGTKLIPFKSKVNGSENIIFGNVFTKQATLKLTGYQNQWIGVEPFWLDNRDKSKGIYLRLTAQDGKSWVKHVKKDGHYFEDFSQPGNDRILNYIEVMMANGDLAKAGEELITFKKTTGKRGSLFFGNALSRAAVVGIEAYSYKEVTVEPVWLDKDNKSKGVYLKLTADDGQVFGYEFSKEFPQYLRQNMKLIKDIPVYRVLEYIEAMIENKDLAQAGERIQGFTERTGKNQQMHFGTVFGRSLLVTLNGYPDHEMQVQPVWVDEKNKAKGVYLKLTAKDGRIWVYELSEDFATYFQLNKILTKRMNFSRKMKGIYSIQVDFKKQVNITDLFSNEDLAQGILPADFPAPDGKPWPTDKRDMQAGKNLETVEMTISRKEGKLSISFKGTQAARSEVRVTPDESSKLILNYIETVLKDGDLADAGAKIKTFKKKTDKNGNLLLGRLQGRSIKVAFYKHGDQEIQTEAIWTDEKDPSKGIYLKFSAADGNTWYRYIKKEAPYFEDRYEPGVQELFEYIQAFRKGADLSRAGEKLKKFSKRTDGNGNLAFGTMDRLPVMTRLKGYVNQETEIEPLWIDEKNKNEGIYLKFTAADGSTWYKSIGKDGAFFEERAAPGEQELLEYIEIYAKGGDLTRAGERLKGFRKKTHKGAMLTLGRIAGRTPAIMLYGYEEQEIEVQPLWIDESDKSQGVYLQLTAPDGKTWYRKVKKDGAYFEERAAPGEQELLEYIETLAKGGDLAQVGEKLKSFTKNTTKNGALYFSKIADRLAVIMLKGYKNKEVLIEPVRVSGQNKSQGIHLKLTTVDGKIYFYEMSANFLSYFQQNSKLTQRANLERELKTLYQAPVADQTVNVTLLFNDEELAQGILPADFPAPNGGVWPADKRDMQAGKNLEKVEMTITRKDGKLSISFKGTQDARSEVRSETGEIGEVGDIEEAQRRLVDYIKVFINDGNLAESGDKLSIFTKKVTNSETLHFGSIDGRGVVITLAGYSGQDIEVEPLWVDEDDKSKGIYLKFTASDGSAWYRGIRKEGNYLFERPAPHENELLDYVKNVVSDGDLAEAGRRVKPFKKKTTKGGTLFLGKFQGRRVQTTLTGYGDQEINVQPLWIDEDDKSKGIYLKLEAADGKVWYRDVKKEGFYFKDRPEPGLKELLDYIKAVESEDDLSKPANKVKPFKKKTAQNATLDLGLVNGVLARIKLRGYPNQEISIEPVWVNPKDKSQGIYLKLKAEDGRVWNRFINKKTKTKFEKRNPKELLDYIKAVIEKKDLSEAGRKVQAFEAKTNGSGNLLFGKVGDGIAQIDFGRYVNQTVKVTPIWEDEEDKAKGIYLRLETKDGKNWYRGIKNEGHYFYDHYEPGVQEIVDYVEAVVKNGDLHAAGSRVKTIVKKANKTGFLHFGYVNDKKVQASFSGYGNQKIKISPVWIDEQDKSKGIYLAFEMEDESKAYRSVSGEDNYLQQRSEPGVEELAKYVRAVLMGKDLGEAGAQVKPFTLKTTKAGVLSFGGYEKRYAHIILVNYGNQDVKVEPVWIDAKDKSKGIYVQITTNDKKIWVYEMAKEVRAYFRQNKKLTQAANLRRELEGLYTGKENFDETRDITSLFDEQELIRGILPADFPAPDGGVWPADKRDMKAGINLEKVEMIISRKDGKLSISFKGTEAARSEVRTSDQARKKLIDYIKIFVAGGDLAEAGEAVLPFAVKISQSGGISLGGINGRKLTIRVDKKYGDQEIKIDPQWIDPQAKTKGIYLKLTANDGETWDKNIKATDGFLEERPQAGVPELLKYVQAFVDGQDLGEAGEQVRPFIKRTYSHGKLYFGAVKGKEVSISLLKYPNQHIAIEPLWIDSKDKTKGIYLKLTAPDGYVWYKQFVNEGFYFKQRGAEGVQNLLDYIKAVTEEGDLSEAGDRVQPFVKNTNSVGALNLGVINNRSAVLSLKGHHNQEIRIEPSWMNPNDKTKGIYLKLTAETGRVWYYSINKDSSAYVKERAEPGSQELLDYIEAFLDEKGLAEAGDRVLPFIKKTDANRNLNIGTVRGRQAKITFRNYANQEIKIEPQWIDSEDKAKGLYLKLTADDGEILYKSIKVEGNYFEERPAPGVAELLSYVETVSAKKDLAQSGERVRAFVKKADSRGNFHLGYVNGKIAKITLKGYANQEIKAEPVWIDPEDKGLGIYLKLTAGGKEVGRKAIKGEGTHFEDMKEAGMGELRRYFEAVLEGGNLSEAAEQVQPFRRKAGERGKLSLGSFGKQRYANANFNEGYKNQEVSIEPLWIDVKDRAKGIYLKIEAQDGNVWIYNILKSDSGLLSLNEILTKQFRARHKLKKAYEETAAEFEMQLNITELFSEVELAEGVLPADFPAPNGGVWPADKRDMRAGKNLEKVEMIISRKDGRLSISFKGTQAARSEVRGDDSSAAEKISDDEALKRLLEYVTVFINDGDLAEAGAKLKGFKKMTNGSGYLNLGSLGNHRVVVNLGYKRQEILVEPVWVDEKNKSQGIYLKFISSSGAVEYRGFRKDGNYLEIRSEPGVQELVNYIEVSRRGGDAAQAGEKVQSFRKKTNGSGVLHFRRIAGYNAMIELIGYKDQEIQIEPVWMDEKDKSQGIYLKLKASDGAIWYKAIKKDGNYFENRAEPGMQELLEYIEAEVKGGDLAQAGERVYVFKKKTRNNGDLYFGRVAGAGALISLSGYGDQEIQMEPVWINKKMKSQGIYLKLSAPNGQIWICKISKEFPAYFKQDQRFTRRLNLERELKTLYQAPVADQTVNVTPLFNDEELAQGILPANFPAPNGGVWPADKRDMQAGKNLEKVEMIITRKDGKLSISFKGTQAARSEARTVSAIPGMKTWKDVWSSFQQKSSVVTDLSGGLTLDQLEYDYEIPARLSKEMRFVFYHTDKVKDAALLQRIQLMQNELGYDRVAVFEGLPKAFAMTRLSKDVLHVTKDSKGLLDGELMKILPKSGRLVQARFLDSETGLVPAMLLYMQSEPVGFNDAKVMDLSMISQSIIGIIEDYMTQLVFQRAA